MCGPGVALGVVVLSMPIGFIIWATHQFGLTGFIVSACLVGATGLRISQEHQRLKRNMEDGNHRD